MTLALLLTAVTGAWAADTYTVAGSNSDMFGYVWDPTNTANDMTKNGDGTYSITYTNVNFTENEEVQYKVVKNHSWNEAYPAGGNRVINIAEAGTYTVTIHFNPTTHEVYETMPGSGSGEPDIEVTWNAATKTGTFTMPAFDVEIAPIYAKAAAFATTGTEPEVKTLLPTAIEGIFAGTTDAIVKAGTVAMMGKTENPQGIVMYAVTSINQATAPELSAFSADVPTAENIADEGADVLVWYYIQGANTPDGQEATAENTFNDSEIFAEPIKVTVLPNKYDIQSNAANANTIEAGKATVTVGGTAATVTEGKLKAVKMGSEVKVKAKQGYKFRKVEVKKKAALLTLSVCGETIYYAEGETWAEAIQNHPTENQGWEIYGGDVNHDNLGFLMQNDDWVPGTAKIDPNASYDYGGI